MGTWCEVWHWSSESSGRDWDALFSRLESEIRDEYVSSNLKEKIFKNVGRG